MRRQPRRCPAPRIRLDASRARQLVHSVTAMESSSSSPPSSSSPSASFSSPSSAAGGVPRCEPPGRWPAPVVACGAAADAMAASAEQAGETLEAWLGFMLCCRMDAGGEAADGTSQRAFAREATRLLRGRGPLEHHVAVHEPGADDRHYRRIHTAEWTLPVAAWDNEEDEEEEEDEGEDGVAERVRLRLVLTDRSEGRAARECRLSVHFRLDGSDGAEHEFGLRAAGPFEALQPGLRPRGRGEDEPAVGAEYTAWGDSALGYLRALLCTSLSPPELLALVLRCAPPALGSLLARCHWVAHAARTLLPNAPVFVAVREL